MQFPADLLTLGLVAMVRRPTADLPLHAAHYPRSAAACARIPPWSQSIACVVFTVSPCRFWMPNTPPCPRPGLWPAAVCVGCRQRRPPGNRMQPYERQGGLCRPSCAGRRDRRDQVDEGCRMAGEHEIGVRVARGHLQQGWPGRGPRLEEQRPQRDDPVSHWYQAAPPLMLSPSPSTQSTVAAGQGSTADGCLT